MSARVELEIEIIRPRSPLAPPPRTGFLSPTLLDSLLGLLPVRASSRAAEQAPPTESDPQPLLDLGFDPGGQDARGDDEGQEVQGDRDEDPGADDTESAAQGAGRPSNLQTRVRALSAAEQQRLARSGEQGERVALERIYGKAVWENLLRNPKITPPEVARIARMGTVPQPLIEVIVGNRAWLASAQVRRALLQNRRLKNEMILSVLRATPKSELRLVPKQSAYSAAVREAAVKLIK